MVSAVEVLFVAIVAAGLALAGLGYVCHRRWDQLGLRALVAFAVILGLGNVLSGGLGLFLGSTATAMPLWSQLAIFSWAVASVPWLLFAVQYTGRRTRIRQRTVGLLYVPFVGFGISVTQTITGVGGAGIASAIASLAFIYCFALVFLGAYLLVQATYSYVHLSLTQGLAVATAPVAVVLAGNSIQMLRMTSTLLAVGSYAFALAAGTALFGLALLSDPLLKRTPAVETLGERAITRETDDLVFVVDGADTVVECNETAAETLSVAPILGEPLPESLGYDSTTLEARETVSLDTTAGKRRYDPEVSPIADDRGVELGAVLSLRDVTERELREQRLAVLNRVLRHNLRNKVDVVKSHAEVIADERVDGHASAIVDAVDEITELGYRARTIDQFVSDSGGTQRIDIVEVVETARNGLETDGIGVSMTFDIPDSGTVETNRRALVGALESALDNAVEYADSTVELSIEARADGYDVVVSDDGPGIPDRELDSIDSGTETPLQHGTGLGLWQLKWAVTTIGGELAFDTSEGTTVRITVPDRRESATPATHEE